MAPGILALNAQNRPPGVYFYESTAGYVPTEVANHSTSYVLLTGTKGDYNTPIQVTEIDDAIEKFGVSSWAEASIAMQFLIHPSATIYGIRVATYQEFLVTIGSAAVGTYNVSVGGQSVQIAAASASLGEIVSGLVDAINDASSPLASIVEAQDSDAVAGTFRLRALSLDPIAVTVSASAGAITVAETTGSDPSARDWVYAIQNSFDQELHKQGFLSIPEAFATIDDPEERATIGAAMIAYCTEHDWFALIDPGNPETAVRNDTEAETDGLRYTSPRGHCSFTIPYARDFSDRWVVPSALKAGVALSRFDKEGSQHAPAGPKYPLPIKSLAFSVSENRHATLNNVANINVIRYKRNKGFLILGARCRTDNAFFQMEHERIVFNVVMATLREAYSAMLFESITGRADLYREIERTGYSALFRMWQAGMLWGDEPSSGFAIRCRAENNPDLDLENSQLRVDVWATPPAVNEKTIGNVRRVAIGSLPVILAN